MKKMLCAILAAALLICGAGAAGAPVVNAKSLVLMEKTTGTVLFEQNAHEPLAPASVTKVMTLLLVMEAMDAGLLAPDTMITASAHAAGMGGTQIYLEEGETMSASDLLKSVCISSANDAAVALGEYVSGSESAFVDAMNRRAAELGMNDSTFMNCTGLTAAGHVTSAYDIALMSSKLLKYDLVREYAQTWMDTVRNGEFGLANTNKMLRSFNGITGLKTGFTDEAMYCVSATAERDGMELIAAVMGAQTKEARTETASSALNWGFANYTLVSALPDEVIAPVRVRLGKAEAVQPVPVGGERLLIEKSLAGTLDKSVEICDDVLAPVSEGQILGELVVSSGGRELARLDLVASCGVEKLSWWNIFSICLKTLFTGGIYTDDNS